MGRVHHLVREIPSNYSSKRAGTSTQAALRAFSGLKFWPRNDREGVADISILRGADACTHGAAPPPHKF